MIKLCLKYGGAVAVVIILCFLSYQLGKKEQKIITVEKEVIRYVQESKKTVEAVGAYNMPSLDAQRLYDAGYDGEI